MAINAMIELQSWHINVNAVRTRPAEERRCVGTLAAAPCVLHVIAHKCHTKCHNIMLKKKWEDGKV